MGGAGDHVISVLVFGVVAGVAAIIVRLVTPRSVGLLIGEALVFLSAGCCLTTLIIPVATTYTAGPHAKDLLLLWPAALAMLLLVLVPTRRPHSEHACECGYDLRGNTSAVCPECGRSIVRQNGSRITLVHRQHQQAQ